MPCAVPPFPSRPVRGLCLRAAQALRRAPLCVLLFGLALLPVPGRAQTSGEGLPGYEHSAWMVGQGAPGDIWDIVQAGDGALLLATGSGLYRFDGRQFSRRSAPPGSAFSSSNMTTLLREADGSLWIGYYNAGISRIDRHGMQHYQRAQGLPPGLVPRIERDGNGRLWAATDGGLRWFDGHRWQAPLPQWGIGDVPAHWLLRDRQQTLWVIAGGQLWRLPAGTSRFQPLPLPVARLSTLALRGDGQLWLADRQRGLMPVADTHGLLPAARREAGRLPQLRAGRIRFAADGSLWGSRIAHGGIFRVQLHGDRAIAVQQFDSAQGLSSTTAVPLLEDHERTLWVGTNLGLNRFVAHQVHALPRPAAGDPLHTLYRAANGEVFAYGQDLRPLALQRSLLAAPATAMAAAAAASNQPLWVEGRTTLQLWRNGQAQAQLPPAPDSVRELRALAPLDAGQAWFCFGADSVLRYQHGQWTRDRQLPRQACSSIGVDRQGQALLGYPDGSLRVQRGARWRHYGPADGLQVGPVTAVAMVGPWLWVAGETGLAVLGVDQRFHPLRAGSPGLLEGISGIAADASGYYWLNGSRGLLRIEAATLERAALRDELIAPRLYDTADGMPGIATQTSPLPSLALAADGLLWVSTNQGLAWLDTLQVQRSAPAPTPRIGNVLFGDQQRALHDGLVLPAGTSQLQIDYMAVALSRPERSRYRYRLLGLDERWQDAGTLTRAFYTNLPPGQYRFEVAAANQDMAWSPLAAHRSFRIAPAWYQTLWFKLAGALALLATLLLALRLRHRRLTQLVHARLEERHAERERIARELHDTLLQGTQGLILQLHAASRAEHTPPALRASLEQAMQQAETALAEARERVGELRDGSSGYQDLGAALVQVYGERAADSSSPALRLNVEGTPRPLRHQAAEEVFLIGREALLNALHHADAGAIEIELVYGRRGLGLHVRDDGSGLPATAADGHWGLVGMRERADRLGARLRLWSRPGLGTEVELYLPAERIYRHSRRRWRWRRSAGDTA